MAVRRILFLDIDGVLNRAGYRPQESSGLHNWIEPELASRLSAVLHEIDADIVMSSDWRLNRTLEQIRAELAAAGVTGTLVDVTPELAGKPRWREIDSWLVAHHVDRDSIVIVDDLHDMGDLAARFVRANPFSGFDDSVAISVRALFAR